MNDLLPKLLKGFRFVEHCGHLGDEEKKKTSAKPVDGFLLQFHRNVL